MGRSLVAAGVLAFVLTACSTVVDVDRFHSASESQAATTSAANSPYLDLRFSMLTFKPHGAHPIEYRVIDAQNAVQSRGVIVPPNPLDIVLRAPRAIPRANGPYRLDFFADVNGSGGYDGLGSVTTNDHAWRIEPLADYPEGTPATPGAVTVTFVHNTSFTDIDDHDGVKGPPRDTGLGAHVHVKGLAPVVGKLLEVRISDAGSGHTVGLWRTGGAPLGELDAIVPGIVDVSTDYDVTLYADANGNGIYDDPSAGAGDLGWRARVTSDASGVEATFDASDAAAGRVDVGAP